MAVYDSRDTRYKTPFGAVAAGEEVRILFPVEKTRLPEGVFLVARGVLNARIPLEIAEEDEGHLFFSCRFSPPVPGIVYYRFEIKTAAGFLFVGRDEEGKARIRDWLPEWQLTVFQQDYVTPDWLKGGVVYHIFADRFAREENDRKPRYGYLKPWYEDVEVHNSDGSYAADDFFGGNARGILSRLDYLESLGVTAIYLSPVFESSSNHRYDTGDYTKIDSLFGTEEEFKEMVAACGAKGIGIILDGVFNHTGADSLYFNKFSRYPGAGAYQGKESPYFDWFTFGADREDYMCWWGVKSVPTVKRDCTSFQDFIAAPGGIIDRWNACGISGWRLDVADELSSDFIEKIRIAVKRGNPERVLIGEVWEDASTKVSYSQSRSYLFGKELDGVMNYPFRTSILNYIKNCDAYTFAAEIGNIIENYPKQALDCSFSMIGSHDTVRAINALSDAVPPHDEEGKKHFFLSPRMLSAARKRLMLAASLQYFLPGVPSLYYGDETALQGYADPLNRRTYPWGKEDNQVLDFYRFLGNLRKKNRDCFVSRAFLHVFGSAVCVIRDKLALYVNPSEESVPVPRTKDILTGAMIAELPPLSLAISFRDP
jgi:glycosidase